jgi:hypothetical protein
MSSWISSRYREKIDASLARIITWRITVVVLTSTIVNRVRILSYYQTLDAGMVRDTARGVWMPIFTPVMIAVRNTGLSITIARMTTMMMTIMESSIVTHTDHAQSSLALVSII